MIKGKVRINQEGQKRKCPAVGELAPSMESWPELLHTSTNVSLQAAGQKPRLHQMTLPGLSDDSGRCLVVEPLAHSVENQVIRRL